MALANLHQKRNMLFEDWANRSKYDLPAEMFSNEYLQKEIQLGLYEYILFSSPQESEYEESGPKTKTLRIVPEEILFSDDGNVIVPLWTTTRKAPESTGWEPIKLSFYTFDPDLRICNYQGGTIFGHLAFDDITPKLYHTYSKEDWDHSWYNVEYLEKRAKEEPSVLIQKGRIECVQSNRTREECKNYLKPIRESLEKPLLKSASPFSAFYHAYTGLYMDLYSTSYNSAYVSFTADCANFVSQCMKFGGFQNDGSNSSSDQCWFYNDQGTSSTSDDVCSLTWSTANSLQRYIANNGYGTAVSAAGLYNGSEVSRGDVFFFKHPPTSSVYTHSMMVYSPGNTEHVTTYCAHSNNRYNYGMDNFEGGLSYWTDRAVKGYHITSFN
ncbi:MAG: amidase domain-containing protein [Candidatus Peribacteria bacterium]|jgi:hypothetical protein|nr:amidase domain-containing protein [Candidatus Peribacteria bacterium]